MVASTTIQQVARDSVRAVAVTIDDLPTVKFGREGKLAEDVTLTENLLQKISKLHIPVVGFVCENQLAVPGEEKQRAGLLRRWVDAGIELGNHTYSHLDFSVTPLDSFKADVLRGETVTKALMEEAGMRLRYFRHPFLQTGDDEPTKTAFEQFLLRRGYTVAPVTVANFDWEYNAAYVQADDDSLLQVRVARAYLEFTDKFFEWAERFSRDMLGYEVWQILLLHANPLNADYFDELVEVISGRGYQFISLDEALADEAYRRGDPVATPKSLTWLHRWALSLGLEFPPIPTVHPFVRDLAGLDYGEES